MDGHFDPLGELSALEGHDSFVARHVAPNEAEIAGMLAVVGAASLDDLAARTVPATIRALETPGLPDAIDEAAMIAELRGLAQQNRLVRSLIGQGYYGTHTPPVIRRNILENPGWYTAYTPYQAEIAQGRLEALLNYQTMICDLTGMEIANASLLDEATAAAEAVTMAHAASRTKSDVVVVCTDLHPQTRAVLMTRAAPVGVHACGRGTRRRGGHRRGQAVRGGCCNTPAPRAHCGTSGRRSRRRMEVGALAIVCADLLSLVLLKPPGAMGADVVVGSAQRFGVPMGFGGPHAGFFATRDAFKRQMPGRLGGRQSGRGRRPGAPPRAANPRAAYPAGEGDQQHLHRAGAAGGDGRGCMRCGTDPPGLTRIARRVNLQARAAGGRGVSGGVCAAARYLLSTPSPSTRRRRSRCGCWRPGFNVRRLEGGIAISLDETVTRPELERLAEAIGAPLIDAAASMPPELLRGSPVLPQPVFSAYHAEHEMLRYLKRLEDKDVALNRSMIPLGSCTMKLNATAEMIPITMPGFCDIHPFAPADQTLGYATLIERLSAWLCAVTGFAGVSLQPNGRQPGRICRPAGDTRLPPGAGRGAARHLPDSQQRPRHQPGQRSHGRLPRGGDRVRPGRQRGSG